MKFMKLGSKPDYFDTNENGTRYVATDLAPDIIVHVGDTKFHLHKFPLFSKSARLQKLVSSSSEAKEKTQNKDEIHIPEIPGGPIAFETCAKFCYGIAIALNAHNVVSTRRAAEYLEMHESVERGNLVSKIDAFLNSIVLRNWKDSIALLQTMNGFSEDSELAGRCVDSIACRASVNASEVNWAYTYDRTKAAREDIRTFVPNDWWAEDLCDLEIKSYESVVRAIKRKGLVSNESIGQALKAYAYKNLSGSCEGAIGDCNGSVFREILDAIVWLLPKEKGCVSCGFLLRLLRVSIRVDSEESVRNILCKKIGQQLEEADVDDLLFRARDDEGTVAYDVVIVRRILEEHLATMRGEDCDEAEIARDNGILCEASKLMVAKLIDKYLSEIAKDPYLPLSDFLGIAEMGSNFSRPSHDGLYRAVDTYLQAHPTISKSEKKTICGLMDCKRLSAEACAHAVQNERLPVRVITQILFFEQARANASVSGTSTPDMPKSMRDVYTSYRSSKSVTPKNEEDINIEEEEEEVRALRGEIAAIKLAVKDQNDCEGKGAKKMRSSIVARRVFSRLWSAKSNRSVNSGSVSPESIVVDVAKCGVPVRGRHSVS